MKIEIEKIDEQFKYSFTVPFQYSINELPKSDLIKSLYAITGYKVSEEFTYEFPFGITVENELSTENVFEYIEEYTKLLNEQGFREKSINFVQSVILRDIAAKSEGLT